MRKNKAALFLIIIMLLISCRAKKTDEKTYEINDIILMIDKNDVESLRKIIPSNFNSNETIDEDGITFLDYAIEHNKDDVALFLIENGADVNHVDQKGKTTFSKAIGKISPELLNAFLEHGLDFTSIVRNNMNYFVYMLYEKDYSTAFNFIMNESVYDYFSKEDDLFVYLIYYWNSNWSPKIGNIMVSNNYQYDRSLSYFFYAIDEYSLDAIKWLENIGFQIHENFYYERFNLFYTPLEYAENKLFEMTSYLGKDYVYSQNDEDVIALKNIIEYLADN